MEMVTEPIWYRVWKRALQSLSARSNTATQLDRLERTDWDVLVVLDACRWDVLDEVASWPINSAVSPGSATDEWLSVLSDRGSFQGTNIATGSVMYDRFDLEAADVANIWHTDWNNELGTVLPGPILDRANNFLETSDRPVVAHLMQPHAPYIARIDDIWLPAYPQSDAWSHAGATNVAEDETPSAQVAMAAGQIDIRRARNSYEASVESTWNCVAPYVSDWVEAGHEVVVTADHGEGFGTMGDLGLYGHPNRCRVNSLVQVPFERFCPTTRRREAPTSVEEKLEALGYAD